MSNFEKMINTNSEIKNVLSKYDIEFSLIKIIITNENNII